MSTSNLVLEDSATQSSPGSSRIIIPEWHDRTRQHALETNDAWPKLPQRGTISRCSQLDVVAAFRIVNLEIRTKCERLAARSPTLGQVWELARRIKDQRDLVQQIDERRALKHVWRLRRQNTRLRNRLVQIAQRWGIDTSILIFE